MRPNLTPTLRGLALCTGLVLPLGALASSGYWTNSFGETWHTSAGECWRSGNWEARDATAECDPGLMPKPAPKPAPAPAAQTQPAPPPPPPPKPKMITLSETASGRAHMGFDKYAVTPAQARILNSQLQGISDAQVQSIKVTGYTDRIGSRAYNMKLSDKRAKAVADYIEQHYNIEAGKIQTRGMGPADPVVQCRGVAGRAALIKCLAPNRRVTVEVDMLRTKTVMPSSDAASSTSD